MRLARIAAAAAIATAVLTPTPATADQVCNPESAGFDQAACEQQMAPVEDYEADGCADSAEAAATPECMDGDEPAPVPEDLGGNPSGNFALDCEATADEYIADVEAYYGQTCPQNQASEPAAEPVYKAPETAAEHLGGCAYWHKHADIVTCRGTARIAR